MGSLPHVRVGSLGRAKGLSGSFGFVLFRVGVVHFVLRGFTRVLLGVVGLIWVRVDLLRRV